MSEFDPYYKWLAIPPAEQPPHHYRLLGVVLFEADADVISAAADRQMSHVRSYQHGPHSERSQQLLNEISNARVTLLRPETKAQYDAQLKARLGPAPASAHPAPHPTPASGARPAPAHKPLKVATPLHAPTPLRQAQPLPQGGQSGQGPTHPQPIPQAARPAPQQQPITAAIVEDSPVMVSDKPSPDGEPAPDRRRGKKQKGLVGMIAGIVGGGIMGTYIAGIILNCLGAPIPDAVRFLPGLREGKQVADNRPVENTNNNGQGTNNNAGNYQNNQFDPRKGHNNALTQGRVPANSDLWKLSKGLNINRTFEPGRHKLTYIEEDGEPKFRMETITAPSGTPVTTNAFYSDILLKSPSIRCGYEEQLNAHFLYAVPNTIGRIAIPISIPANTKLTNCYVNFLITPSKNVPSPPAELVLAKSIKRDTAYFETQDVIRKEALGIGGNNRPVSFPEGLREYYLVFVLNNTPPQGAPPLTNEEGKRLYMQPDKFTITFQVEPSGGTFAATNNNNGNNNSNNGGTYIPVQPDAPNGAAKWPIPDASQVAAEMIRLQGRNNNDPRYWIQAAEAESTPLLKYAMLNLAAKRAVDAGDVQQLAYAYERTEASFTSDFALEQASFLTQLADGKKAGFQPAVFASFSLKVLKKMRSKGELSRHAGLLSSALGWAREARDYDSLRELTLLAAEVRP